MEDIKNRLLKIAEEKANEKIKKELEKAEENIKDEVEDVEKILKMIDKKMLYKINFDKKKNTKFIMITEEIFFQDYLEDNNFFGGSTIRFKNYTREEYEVEIKVNGIEYYHIGSLIQKFESKLKEKITQIERVTVDLRRLEDDFKDLVNQEKNIKKFIEDYNETEKNILEE